MAAAKRRPAARRPAAKKRASRARKPLPPWVLLGGGLLIGVAAAFLFNTAQDWPALWQDTPEADSAATASAPARRFDFYTILPNQEAMVPEEKPAPSKEAPSTKKKSAPVPRGTYYLQVGSFRKLQEANGMRARVILLGTQASIQTVAIDRDTWHRVRVGPYKDPARLREVRKRLRDNRIEALLVRAVKKASTAP